MEILKHLAQQLKAGVARKPPEQYARLLAFAEALLVTAGMMRHLVTHYRNRRGRQDAVPRSERKLQHKFRLYNGMTIISCSWPVTFEQARDSRKTGLGPIWLVTDMYSIHTINAECACLGSCSPHTESRETVTLGLQKLPEPIAQ
jgi:hypothetical protein